MYGGFEFDMSVDSYDKLIQLISGNLMSEASSFPVWGRRGVWRFKESRWHVRGSTTRPISSIAWSQPSVQPRTGRPCSQVAAMTFGGIYPKFLWSARAIRSVGNLLNWISIPKWCHIGNKPALSRKLFLKKFKLKTCSHRQGREAFTREGKCIHIILFCHCALDNGDSYAGSSGHIF